jgi:hypothetical protein
MKSINGHAWLNGALATPLTRAESAAPMQGKSVGRALLATAALFIASVCSAAPMPVGQFNYEQLSSAVRLAEHDVYNLSGFIGAAVSLDLRPIRGQSYFASATDPQGIAFVCPISFTDFTGGPVKDTIDKFEFGEDRRDFIKLDGCTPQER